MERYENLGLVGEGSYGMVLKCRHKETSQVVAIKKFIESEDDKMVKKIAVREIKMLKQLRHENLVNLLEVFRRKRRLFLVFEFVDRTVLDDLEKYPDGLSDSDVKNISFQVLRGLEFCHSHSVIHRDVKPENILISKSGIVKLCDFGFARTLATGPGEVFTDYVATRWYRAPELLVGDLNYGKAVDTWAVGCLLYEVVTGDPLFPGDSDIDQLFHITKALGNLTKRHQDVFYKNPLFTGMKLPNVRTEQTGKKFKNLSFNLSDLITQALSLDVSQRLSCLEMLKHPYYQEENFAETFLVSLKEKVDHETATNPYLKLLASQKSKKLHNSQSQKESHQSSSPNKHSKQKTHGSNEKNNHKNSVKANYSASSPSQDKATGYQYCPALPATSLKTINNKGTSLKKNNEQNFKQNGMKKIADSERIMKESSKASMQFHTGSPDSKGRTFLDMSVNQPGKNLPEISSSVNVNRARGHDVLKQKKGGGCSSTTTTSKRNPSNTKQEHQQENVVLCPVAEKAVLYQEPIAMKSCDDLTTKASSRTKQSHQGGGDVECGLPKVSGLLFPSVKTDVKSTRTSPTKVGAGRKMTTATIPHIQNIDLFSNHSTPSKESTSSSNRSNNLPAV